MNIHELETIVMDIQRKFESGSITKEIYKQQVVDLNIHYYFYEFLKEIQRKPELHEVIVSMLNYR